jgi:hypothetical protein
MAFWRFEVLRGQPTWGAYPIKNNSLFEETKEYYSTDFNADFQKLLIFGRKSDAFPKTSPFQKQRKLNRFNGLA